MEEYATEFFSMINRVDLQDSESQLVTRFIGGLRQHIQHTLNLFRPLSVSEAHQQALTVEIQTRTGFFSWSSSRPVRTITTTAPPSTSDSPATKPETTIVSADQTRLQHPGAF